MILTEHNFIAKPTSSTSNSLSAYIYIYTHTHFIYININRRTIFKNIICHTEKATSINFWAWLVFKHAHTTKSMCQNVLCSIYDWFKVKTLGIWPNVVSLIQTLLKARCPPWTVLSIFGKPHQVPSAPKGTTGL